MVEPACIGAFRRLISDFVDEFVNASRGFGEPLTAMAYLVRRAFELELEFIIIGVRSPQPDDSAFNRITEPLSGTIREIQEFRGRNRHIEEYFNHLSTVSESIVALSWISVRPAPAQFVRDMRDAGDYFGNRVLATNRGNQRHASWISLWNDVLKQLEQYVRDFHLTGFAWNSVGPDSGPSAPPGPPPPGPPPPGPPPAGPPGPPPPPPPQFRPDPSGDDRSALLSDLNQGVGITKMLRPVRRPDNAPASQASVSVTVPPSHTAQPTARVYPPKFCLDGKKWRVEHQKDDYSLVINNDNMSESLSMFKCINTGLEVRNKMNGVTIDNCRQTTVVLNGIISSVELIRCERVKIQCSGHVPLISLDSCDSVQIFLTEESLDAEVVQSKTTSCNLCILKPDGDYTELPLPEQIRTVVVDGSLKSSVVEKN